MPGFGVAVLVGVLVSEEVTVGVGVAVGVGLSLQDGVLIGLPFLFIMIAAPAATTTMASRMK